VKPDISINGRVVESLAAYEALLDAQGKPVTYEISSFDAHSVNPNFALGCPDALAPVPPSSSAEGGSRTPSVKVAKSIRDGERISFVVQVSGTVRYGKPGDAANAATAVPVATPEGAAAFGGGVAATEGPTEQAFNESWLLVPHWEALHPNAARGLRKWVVASQNFRAL
jgi:NTF2-related export protein 1/2